jgi:diguanylate cyclase (GGDEF)-like protein
MCAGPEGPPGEKEVCMNEDQFRMICGILRRNEELARKFFEIESEILSVLDYKGLFERLVSRIKDKLGVPYVWITVIRDTMLHDMLRLLSTSPLLMDRIGVIERGEFLALFPDRPEPVLVNRDLKPFYCLFPHDRPLPVRSMAVAPLWLDGELIGCLNQADPDPERFRPDMDTGLLDQLAIKISLCLSNVTAHERLRMTATTDPLTGLVNRRTMEEKLHEEFLRAKRYGTALSAVFIDLDGFKQVNDTNGHDAGDKLLKFFAHELREMSREVDMVCRFAGDEFVVITPNTEKNEAEAFMLRVTSHFESTPVRIAGQDKHVDFSFGTADTGHEDAVSPAALLKLADTALYERKRAKKSAAAGAGKTGDG